MTLYELWLVVTKRWKLIITLPLACVLACGIWYFTLKTDSPYVAEAKVIANSQVAYLTGAANAQASALYDSDEDDSGIIVAAKSDTTNMTVVVTATGYDSEKIIDAANSIAEFANKSATEAFSDFENPYSGRVEPALHTSNTESTSVIKYIIVALFAGLLISICISVMLDSLHRPIKTLESIRQAVDLPVLEILPTTNGTRLLANVRFASGNDNPSSILVIPTGEYSVADKTAELLRTAIKAEAAEITVLKGSPLSEGISIAYTARDVDAVIITVQQWGDSLPELESSVEELKLANAKIVGVVFSNGK